MEQKNDKTTVQKEDVKIDKDVKIDNKSKKDFLNFLDENKKDLATGFGAFHTDNHGNW